MKKLVLSLAAVLGCAALLALILAGPSNGEGAALQTVRMNVQPLALTDEPGPSMLVGGESQPGGYKYVWADIMVDGPGDCRVYFDYKDKDHFHFMDRKGSGAALGLREAGVEQIFSHGILNGKGDGALRVARHGCKIGLFEGSTLVASAFDDRIVEGAAGIRMLSGGPLAKIRAEARDDIHFAEDFMIVQGKSDNWKSNGDATRGDFAVKSLRHPLLSANAFSFFGVGRGIHATTGESWWDNYNYELSMRGPVVGSIGLVFAYQDDKNFGLFRWSSRGKDGALPGKREIVRVSDGKEAVLAESPGGYTPDQWYKATINLGYSRVSVAIDEHVLLDAADKSLAAGGAGVWCDIELPKKVARDPKEQEFALNSLDDLMRQHAVFDDVRIRSQEDYEERFNVNGPLVSGWMTGPGDWKIQPGEGKASSALEVSASGPTKALIGDRRWSQYQVSADVQPATGGAAGIVLLHRDESNYYAVKIEGGALKLLRVADGVERIEDNAPLAVTEGFVRIQASIRHGHIRAWADDGASVESFDGETRLRGRAGLIAQAGTSGAPAKFGSFKIAFIQEQEPLVTTNAIFEEEVTMNEWSNSSSEWIPPSEIYMVENKPANLLWHRSQFPGDVELMVEPREIVDNNFQIGLACSKDGKGQDNGYVFKFKESADAAGTPNVKVQILRQGELVKERILNEETRQLSSLAIRRCGKYVVGLVNGRAALSFRDEAPLKGSKVAYYTLGVLIKAEAVRITSEHFRNDTFSSAPVNWRVAGAGIAQVTNRWECDPRWSFFSLKNDRAIGNPAVLWSKQLYPGDVAVEFYFGNKMDSSRGSPYTYARDVNVTIGSDGSDLRKGYISRDGKIVAKLPVTIPRSMDLHRHWFQVKAERHGNKMSFRVDHYFTSPDRKVTELEFEDTAPLGGDRVAIWTYNHAIMISKVRISGDGGETTESPDFLPGPVKTVYDK